MSDQAPQKPNVRATAVDWGITIAITVVMVVLIHTFVGEPFVVPTGSMLDTIQLNDRIWGEKLSYRFREPEAGEVVMFNNPDESGTILVKRVVALAGQTVDLQNGQVVVDGVALDEPYVSGRETQPINRSLPGTEPITYPYVVPQGCVWLMGDNRTNSLDSRYFGAVSCDQIIARAAFVYWPPSDAKVF